jgi:MFS family permease
MKSRYSRNFWIVCFAMFFFMTGFNLIMPELNNFITNLGGENHKGLIILLFSISAGISRPFSGKIADIVGRKWVMYAGIVCSFIICLSYSFVDSILFFLILRFLHGFSAGFAPTGATALLTDVIPDKARGTAMGIWGTFISLGIGVGQSLGSWIYQSFGFDTLFMSAAFITCISFIMVSIAQESLQVQEKISIQHLKITWKDVFEPNVLPAAFVMFLTAICSGIIFVVTPDISGMLQIENKGFFFGFYVISTIVIRLLTSSLSDRIGRPQTLIIGVSILIASMILIALVDTQTSYIVAAIVFGFATGISSPTLFAWTADLSHKDRRGVGAGTMFLALEFGIIAGSLITLIVYDNSSAGVYRAFIIGAFSALLALSFLIYITVKQYRKRVS